MTFTVQTDYNLSAMTAMARALRKTLRKKHSRRSHLFGWTLVALALLLTLPLGGEGLELSFRTLLTWLMALIILLTLLFEDTLNGLIAKKRMLQGMERSHTTFEEEGYTSVTELGTTRWNYSVIRAVAEGTHHFVFIFDNHHGQLYDKRTLAGGTVEDFRRFITEKTGKTITMYEKC